MIGIDEVGRGSWAGPLLVVAVRLKRSIPSGLTGSKLLSRQRRESLMNSIAENFDIGEGWVSPGEVDELGLSNAMRLAVERALKNIDAASTEEIVMDGLINYCEAKFTNVKCVPKADSLFPVVSAASIYAKVKRDQFMSSLGEKYALYGFDKHVGYGTKSHMEAILLHGISDMHRMSFVPIKKLGLA